MKNHTHVRRDISLAYTENVQDFVDRVLALAEDLINPRMEYDYGYDDFSLYVEGWKPMTAEEIKRAESRRKAAQTRARKKREKEAAEKRERELKQLAKLKAKYEES